MIGQVMQLGSTPVGMATKVLLHLNPEESQWACAKLYIGMTRDIIAIVYFQESSAALVCET